DGEAASVTQVSHPTSGAFFGLRTAFRDEHFANSYSTVFDGEELVPGYNARDFYPVNPGQVFHDRYETTAKLGCGSSSTVWLARDLHRWKWQSDRYVVLKINTCDFPDKETAEHELNISQHLATTNPTHKGFPIVRTIISSFEAVSPDGTHMCLVYEPMREPFWLFQRRFKDHNVPLVLLKVHIKILLAGLDYLHSECHIVHTEFEDPAVIEDFAQAQAQNPMPRKTGANGRSIYLSHNDFGPLRSLHTLPKIADFGLAQKVDSSHFQLHPIQADHYRAPEVILGAGWNCSADIWNFGVMMWNLVEKKYLFQNIGSSEGVYSAQAHLAEMIALLGPPPRELLERGREGRRWKWVPAIEDREGKLCERASDFYGGPFFDSEGEFMHKDLIPGDRNLLDTIPSLQGEDKLLFLAFVRKMLQWLPEDRRTAKELLEDPWLSTG
ncbi:hypothetical protein B0A49_05806, partial [Cryomyces minteri]